MCACAPFINLIKMPKTKKDTAVVKNKPVQGNSLCSFGFIDQVSISITAGGPKIFYLEPPIFLFKAIHLVFQLINQPGCRACENKKAIRGSG